MAAVAAFRSPDCVRRTASRINAWKGLFIGSLMGKKKWKFSGASVAQSVTTRRQRRLDGRARMQRPEDVYRRDGRQRELRCDVVRDRHQPERADFQHLLCGLARPQVGGAVMLQAQDK